MSYKIDHSALAREGINILNVVPHDHGISVLFEYSWHDPEMRDKLHWSKSSVFLFHNGLDRGRATRRILIDVRIAREELEGGR